jgi:hypothetical protein
LKAAHTILFFWAVDVIDRQVIVYARRRTSLRIVYARLRHTQQQRGKAAQTHTDTFFWGSNMGMRHTQTRWPLFLSLGLFSPDLKD